MGILKEIIRKKKLLIIRYQGGLGNQMFEYAMRTRLKANGQNVYDDLSFYNNTKGYMPFVLNSVFENIQIDNFLQSSTITKILRKIFMRLSLYKIEDNYTVYDECFLKYFGWIEGYWQSYKYYEPIRDELLNKFKFSNILNEEIKKIETQISTCNSISIHVRAGDYLNETNSKIFGGICTSRYYEEAIKYIESKIDNPVFFVFSDDLEWTRKNITICNAVYVDYRDNDNYEDWMDMYFMSSCKHNIIANSSFSWWGAWLNTNESKIVISPRKWSNKYDNVEVCPENWIRL